MPQTLAADIETPAIRANIEKAGMTVLDEPRATFAAAVKSEHAKYQQIIKEAGIKDERWAQTLVDGRLSRAGSFSAF